MSVTATHHRHVHVPARRILIAAAVALAVLIIALVAAQAPGPTVTSTVEVMPQAVPGAAAVPLPESLGLRRSIQEGVWPAAPAVSPAIDYSRNQFAGTTLTLGAGRTHGWLMNHRTAHGWRP